ncbi:preprotein translocase subunit SecE [Aureimonas altamirensis]|jgi:preprotein translocase subunit SecE|uniref:Protein translocase subunit SecE n=1 Tax=Aureimonas altamirensis DSM 21988 TaxID=1121026 RepID=A0ABY1I4F1_9HYPH|nr:preprotein translocase subunit SecE [Aureimonas altamirensis]SHI57894.1 preprotein translocase subunit SecE [Aureimonas altamirensis DSM 21988]
MASKSNPFTFLQQVRTEVSKVTWPTRRETLISTIMVLIMVVFAAAFFFIADQALGFAVGFIMSAGR